MKVICGRIPKEVFEDQLIPLFEKCGTIWDLRLMMDPMSGYNRSFCFVTFVEKAGSTEAVKQVINDSVRISASCTHIEQLNSDSLATLVLYKFTYLLTYLLMVAVCVCVQRLRSNRYVCACFFLPTTFL